MLYIKNLPAWERVLRLGLGLLIAVLGPVFSAGTLSWIFIAGGLLRDFYEMPIEEVATRLCLTRLPRRAVCTVRGNSRASTC